MPSKLKTIGAYLLRGLFTVIGAIAFGIMTFYVFWELTGEDKLLAYILNGALIVYVIVEDKVRLHLLYKRKKAPFKNRTLTTLFDHIILSKYDKVSIKSSLYLFYIFALVSSHMLILNPYLDVSESIRSYFTTVAYGLVIMMAVDKFAGQFVKDDKRIKTYEE